MARDRPIASFMVSYSINWIWIKLFCLKLVSKEGLTRSIYIQFVELNLHAVQFRITLTTAILLIHSRYSYSHLVFSSIIRFADQFLGAKTMPANIFTLSRYLRHRISSRVQYWFLGSLILVWSEYRVAYFQECSWLAGSVESRWNLLRCAIPWNSGYRSKPIPTD